MFDIDQTDLPETNIHTNFTIEFKYDFAQRQIKYCNYAINTQILI